MNRFMRRAAAAASCSAAARRSDRVCRVDRLPRSTHSGSTSRRVPRTSAAGGLAEASCESGLVPLGIRTGLRNFVDQCWPERYNVGGPA